MSPPLISDYKKGFTLKRLLETWLGGPRLFGTPPVCIGLQIGLFALPAVTLSVINLASGTLGICWKAAVIGLTVLVIDLGLALGISFLKRAKRVAVSPIFSRRGSSFLAEEDQIEYVGAFHRTTWVFIAPNITLDQRMYLVGILLSTLAFALCSPLVILEESGHGVLRGIALFALCVGRYSAVISLPPEIATFDPIRQKNLLYRPFYTAALGLAHTIVILSCKESDHGHSFWFLLCLSSLPFLWGVGVLPPLDALFPTVAEIGVKIMGGSPTYFYIGNFLALLVAFMCPVIVFISRLDNVFIILIECLLGYGISCDIGVVMRLKSSSLVVTDSPRIKGFQKIINILKPVLSISLSLICIGIPMVFKISGQLFEITFISITLSILVTTFILRRFLLHKITKLWSYPYWLNHALNLSLVFLLQFWISVQISSKLVDTLSLKQLVTETLTIRAFALSITNPRLSALDMTITSMLRVFELDTGLDFILLLFLVSILRERLVAFSRHISFVGIVVYATAQSILLDSVCQLLGAIFLQLPYSVFSLLVASLVEGSTLSALFTLPIFLVGFPRPNSFWKGSWFPRPVLSIHGSKKNLDWIIYSDIGKSLTNKFVQSCCRAHIKLETGNCFVARYEDRLLFLRVVTSGWNFAYVQVKGLEMQEQTSCHHQEAAAMDERFEKSFGSAANRFCGPQCHKSPSILQPLMTLQVSTYSQSKSSILSLKTKEERGVFQRMFFRAFSFLWIKSNPLFHGIDAYRKSICSGYNLHSTENTPMGASPLSSSRDNSLDYSMTNERHLTQDFFNHPNTVDDMNSRNIGNGAGNKSFGNELPVWTLTQLPTLPGMEFRKTRNEPMNRSLTLELREERVRAGGFGDLLTNSWVNKCLEDLILPPNVKDKVEELCWEVWTLVFSESGESAPIDLQRFFSEEFVAEILQMMKLDGLSLADTSLQAFRYAVKLALDEIYNGFEPIPDEDIYTDLNYYEDHCVRFCTPSEIGPFIQQKEERIISMIKLEEGISQLRIFNLEKQGVEFRIGKMSRSCVEGIWANLNMELLYLTSDDDERFSIQQDKYLMRNITTQCANTPLGYPVYEATFRINLFNFNINHV